MERPYEDVEVCRNLLSIPEKSSPFASLTRNSLPPEHHRLLAGMCLTCVNPISPSVPSLAPLYGTVLFSSRQPAGISPQHGAVAAKIGASWGLNRNMVLHMGWTYS